MPNQKISAAAIVLILALGGFVTLLAATRFGIGIYPDSVVYLDAARNLLHGAGVSAFFGLGDTPSPLTHFPPLYSCVLALIGATGLDLASAARLLNALLFGGNILVVGLMLRRYARSSFWLPVLGAFLTLVATDILDAHSFALSEALFVLLTMVGLHWLTIYVDNQRRGILVAAAVAIGLSVLTRYIGASSICAGTLVVLGVNGRGIQEPAGGGRPQALSFSVRNLKVKLVDAIIFGSIACVPMGLWAVRNRLAAGRATDQPLVFHPIKLHHFVAAVSTVAQWVLLPGIRHDLRIIGFLIEVLAITVIASYLLRQRLRLAMKERAEADSQTSAALPQILAIFIVCYVALMVFSLSFFDASIVFDSRHLVPVHVATLILALCLGWNLYVPLRDSRPARLLLIIPVVALAVCHGVRGAQWFERVRHDGQGYASREWRESPTIARVKALPEDATIYSNGFDAIYYLTGRRARSIPEKTGYLTGESNSKYDVELKQMRNEMLSHRGELVYFETLPERTSLPPEGELRTKLFLISIAKLSDGSIYETDELAK
jgi:hypothetical protein